MGVFRYSLPEGYEFRHNAQGWQICGNLPKRCITISDALAALLQRLLRGEEPPFSAATQKSLLYLAAKSYLRLEAVPDSRCDAELPLVSVVIPVKNRTQDLRQCLASLHQLDWPKDKLEIIVVDDGSSDDTPEVALAAGVKLIRNESSAGPAAARNRGVDSAHGDILAFIDSDCLADTTWLRELTPWFSFAVVGALGGLVEGYYQQSSLDRYELACSSLSISKHFLYESDDRNSFYVPSCNMLVRRRVFLQLGGFNPHMHVGEDVDLCWRLRDLHWALLFVPRGKVWHKHRTTLGAMLKRKFAYGTSEADLYRRHRDKKKSMPMPSLALLFFLGAAAAILGFWQLLWLVPLALLTSACTKYRLCQRIGQPVSAGEACRIAWRSAVAFCYYLCFHLARYYLLIGGLLACLWPPVALLLLAALLFSSAVDWHVKRLHLNYPLFFSYYLVEQVFYQAGALWGGLKQGYFRFYLLKPRFSR